MKHDRHRPRTATAGPRTFVISFHIRDGFQEEFLALLTPVLDAMRHEATFINAMLHQDPDNPARFMLYETWADLDEVMNVQIGRDYRKAFWDRLPELLSEPRHIQTWQPIRSDFTFFAAW
ncbi:putative quinol monooxygenase [Microvirga rosea]|uniref:putative quinol monooxygenase n=1 Tax=Microvirga rosea TaxID=2715425 RepID=UPI001D0BA034|nr:putative quinol monooxygenase [Microvirga rosea]MCB8820146.1 antibiotic biosynthesis monooxygenase [Microvirga rosea]